MTFALAKKRLGVLSNARLRKLPFAAIGERLEGRFLLAADLSVETTPQPGSLVGSQIVDFTITVQNYGDSSATKTTLVDTLPTGAIVLSSSASTSSGASLPNAVNVAGGTLTASLGMLASGDSDMVSFQIQLGAGTDKISNSATVSSPDEPQSSDESQTATVQVGSAPATSGSLGVTDTASPVTASVGQSVRYTVVVTNTSTTNPVDGLTISDALPASLDCSMATTVVTDPTSPDGFSTQGTVSESAGTVIDDFGSLPAGQMATLTIVGVARQAGTFSDKVNVTSATGADVTKPASTSASITVAPATAGSLNMPLTLTVAPSLPTAGQDMTYQVQLVNSGTSAASNVVVTDPLPAGVQFVSGFWVSPFGTGNVTAANGKATVNLGDIPAAGRATVMLTVIPAQPGTITDTVSFATSSTVSSSTSATASARVAAAAASLLAPVYQAGQPGDGTVSTFVTNLYRELLGRAPDNAGDAYWTNLLNAASGSGSSMPSTAMRNQVASGFLNSPEFEEHFVTGVYKDFLGRSPDQAGMQYFANQLSNTQSLAHVVADVVGSKEFYVNQGGTPQGFVSALYRDLLGRNGNAGDTAYWANQVADGSDSASLSRVALAFLETPEAQQKLLDGNYQAPAGGTPLVAAGQVSAGAYPLAETTGNGFGVLYLQADVESADKSAFFSQMNAASLDFAALEALLSSNQFFSGSSSGSQSTDASFLSGIAADSQRNALLGMIATQLASSTKVAQFGQTIANDQARTIIDVAPVLQVEQLQLPQFSQQDAQTLQNLGALTGTAFDQQFLQFIVQQEQQEVGSLQQEISAGSDTAVRDLASQLLPIFQADLATAQGLTASTGGSTSSLTSSSSSPSSGSTQSNSSSQSGSSASDTQATDAAFLNFAVSGDERETILGLLAEQLAETPAVAAFGQRLAVDHTMTMLSSLPALKASGVQMPPMTPAEEQVIAQYAALAGEGFDSPFGPFMVDDHESDVTHFQNETVTAVNPATAQAAMAALPILQDHLQIAQQLSQLESSGDDGESGS